MIEQGIVMLVQGNAGVSALAATGGFLATLPKDQALPSWSYRVISLGSNNTLLSVKGLKTMRLQIDVYGTAAADVVLLARAIDTVLDGHQGTLSDPDSTFVSGCFSSDEMDFFDDERRSYRRMLEYEVLFCQD